MRMREEGCVSVGVLTLPTRLGAATRRPEPGVPARDPWMLSECSDCPVGLVLAAPLNSRACCFSRAIFRRSFCTSRERVHVRLSACMTARIVTLMSEREPACLCW